MGGVYGTPGYSVFGTTVWSDGAFKDAVLPDRPLALSYWVTVDPNIRSQFGVFWFGFDLISGGFTYGQPWSDSLIHMPGGGSTFWVWQGFNRAMDASGGNTGRFNFKPSLKIEFFQITPVPPTGQFAIAADDHYILIG